MIAALLPWLANAALAAGLPLAPRVPMEPVVVEAKAAGLSPEDFIEGILDCDAYPTDATVFGVVALAGCRTLETRADGAHVVYQTTGASAITAPRHSVLALRVVEQSADRTRVEWDLVEHTEGAGGLSGPYAAAYAENPGAVITPVNYGGWELSGGMIRHWLAVRLGGRMPGALVSDASIAAFGRRLMAVRWGLTTL